MKSMKLYVTGILAAVSLALTCISSHAFVGPTNFFAYNFDNSSQSSIFGNWFGGGYVTNAWDSSQDSSNNVLSGAMELEVNYNGGQYVLWDGATPSYSGLPIAGITKFTNLQFDVMYSITNAPAFRTNPPAGGGAVAGVPDFGSSRIGSRTSGFAQDWYFYYAIPETNSLGNPNTGWNHMNVDLSGVPAGFSALIASGLVNTMFSLDTGFPGGNNQLHGTQFIWFDNIQYNGWISPVPPPVLSIQKTVPGLMIFGDGGQFGRNELQITTNQPNEGWIGTGTTYPVTYSWTTPGNANVPGGLDTHLTFLPTGPGFDTPEGNAGADYQQTHTLWLQIASGNPANTACLCNFSWKTNNPAGGAGGGSNPNAPGTNSTGATNGGVVLFFTNSVRAGTWTLTWNSAITGTITCPGSNSITGNNPIPFDLSNPGPNNGGGTPAPPLSSPDAQVHFANPMDVRIGDMQLGNPGNNPNGDLWTKISIHGTAGTNFDYDFTQQAFNTNSVPSGVDPTLWALNSSDAGISATIQVPTNGAPYWVKWNTPDSTWNNLATATNITGPWNPVEHYNNSYADGTNNLFVIPTQTTHTAVKWNMMFTKYLPTADGSTNLTGALSPDAFFRLTTDTNRPPM